MTDLASYFEERIRDLESYYERTKVLDIQLDIYYYISDEHGINFAKKIIKSNCKNNKKKKNEYERQSFFIRRYNNNNKLQCGALNDQYIRCKSKVEYIHINLNNMGENFKYKYNVPLCKKHTKEIVCSKSQKDLKYGFYYESDLYF